MDKLQPDEIEEIKHENEIASYSQLTSKIYYCLEGQYVEVKELFRNTIYSIYTARDKYLGRKVIVKAIHPWMIKDNDKFKIALNGLYHTVKHISTFKHRNIKTVFSARMDNDVVYFIQEYIHGMPLKEIIKFMEKLPMFEVIRILKKIGNALNYGHERGLIHRHVNIDNIMIDEELEPVITPFKILNTEDHFDDCAKEENFRYQSPEQINEKNSTSFSDQYSLGLVMFEILTGEPLFNKGLELIEKQRRQIYENPEIIRSKLLKHQCPQDFTEIIMKMLNYNPDQRFESMDDLLNVVNIFSKNTENIYVTNVMQSYYRCCFLNKNFIKNFYDKLFEKRPDLQHYFGNMSMEQQYTKLKYSLIVILTIIDQLNHDKFIQIKKTHTDLAISKDMYVDFCDVLIFTISKNDKKWTKNPIIKESWEFLLKKSVEFMLS